jgi:streptomycin 6-kinase
VIVEVPELARQRALSNGSAGEAWLDALPDVLDDLADRWGLTLGRAFVGGTASYVVAAMDADGRRCVLKVGMLLDMYDDDAAERSIAVHRWTGGRGCVRLLDADLDTHPDAPAMLLERLGSNLHDLDTPIPDVLDIVADTLLEFWRPTDAEAQAQLPLPTGAFGAVWLADFITTNWEQLGRPCDRQVIDRAVEYCDQRAAAFDPATAVVVHGDAHGWNTLRADDGTYRFVDPEGLVSAREHDLGIPMREYNEPLLDGDTAALVRQRAERLANRCDADADAVWEWGFVERVSTGLANLRDFTGTDGDNGHLFLEVARRCL